MKLYYFIEDHNKKLIDIKNSRFENISTQNIKSKPAAWIEINLTALAENYQSIKNYVGTDVGVISVIKSDAYGHGLLAIAKTLSSHGTEKLGIASTDEALRLREAGILTPLLLLYPPTKLELETLCNQWVEITMDDYANVVYLNNIAKNIGIIAKIHIQVNTGLNRYGIELHETLKFIRKVSQLSCVSIEGIWTHYADPIGDKSFSKKQFSDFIKLLKEVSGAGIQIPSIHIENSAAICSLNFKKHHKLVKKYMPQAAILVRVGSLLYGIGGAKQGTLKLKPILDSFTTKISATTNITIGNSVGYFRNYIASRDRTIATLPMGWGNSGYNPFKVCVLSNSGRYLEGVGVISANNMAIDITEDHTLTVGSCVKAIKHDDKLINVDNLAKLHGMFTHQFISMLGSKNRRVYFKDAG